MSDNSFGGGFWGILIAGTIGTVLGYKSGHNDAYQQMNDQQRDREIQDLRRQLEQLKVEKK